MERKRKPPQGGSGTAPPQSAIKPGDVVKLKSGGPDMTVGDITGDVAICLHQAGWCEGDTAVHAYTVHLVALCKA